MFCVKCGKKNERGAGFCRYCGSKIKNSLEIVSESFSLISSGRYKEAFDMLSASGEAGSDTKKLLADALFGLLEYEKAGELYLKLPEDIRQWDVLFNLSLIAINKSETSKAIDYLAAIKTASIETKTSPLYSLRYREPKKAAADICLYLGALLKNEGRLEEAYAAFVTAAGYSPASELAYANIGDIAFKNDRYDEAIEFYLKAIEAGQDNLKKSSLHNDLGFAYFRKGSVEEAVESFKQALKLNPDNRNAVHNLGVMYVKNGMQDNVKDDYREFLSQHDGVDIVFNLSRSIMNAAREERSSVEAVDFIGEDSRMKAVKEIIVKAAETDGTVLVQGENGTGKELAARAIHKLSRRSEKPFVVVNCGALPESLLESELFGHEKGAFTGAVKERKGRFELAEGGTIFLDEIGDISQIMQVKLLRVVQHREFERVGGSETIKADVRIIAATNRDIRKMAAEGKFREDLFYRLYVLPVNMPPLRERGSDIMLLAEKFLHDFAERYAKNFRAFSPQAVKIIRSCSWPGNVRELENTIERIVTLYDGEQVEADYLPEEILSVPRNEYEKGGAAAGEKEAIVSALKSVNYSKTKAAKLLGISRVALWKKMKKEGLG